MQRIHSRKKRNTNSSSRNSLHSSFSQRPAREVPATFPLSTIFSESKADGSNCAISSSRLPPRLFFFSSRSQILNTNPHLYFHLQQQKLIELIRYGKVEEAVEFAQEELAPRGEENQNFLEELERIVALLAFEDVKNWPFGELLDLSQRLKIASDVNAAILTSQSHEKDL